MGYHLLEFSGSGNGLRDFKAMLTHTHLGRVKTIQNLYLKDSFSILNFSSSEENNIPEVGL